jgi:hypothetical protein
MRLASARHDHWRVHLAARADCARQLGSRRQGDGWDSSGSQLVDRLWIYEYDAWAEAVALT